MHVNRTRPLRVEVMENSCGSIQFLHGLMAETEACTRQWAGITRDAPLAKPTSLFRCSQVVRQRTVNAPIAGSIPAAGASLFPLCESIGPEDSMQCIESRCRNLHWTVRSVEARVTHHGASGF